METQESARIQLLSSLLVLQIIVLVISGLVMDCKCFNVPKEPKYDKTEHFSYL